MIILILDERVWCQMSRFQTGFGGKQYFEGTVISRHDCTARIIINLIQVWNVQPQQGREIFFRRQDGGDASMIEQHCYMDTEKVCLDQEGAEKELRW